MTNIKNIGKELLGKSLNSYHRRTGLTQLEKNNEMQDGILNGILSQADDAYIEKTEQSNVIHLDGSGDGVVVLDSIEGNTSKLEDGEPIKDGLLCWLDGRDNIENGYWLDRSGNNNNFLINGNVENNDTNLYFNGGHAYSENFMQNVRSMVITFKAKKTIEHWQYLLDTRGISTHLTYVASSGSLNINQFGGFSKKYINKVDSGYVEIPNEQLIHLYLEYVDSKTDYKIRLATNQNTNESLPCEMYSVQFYNRPLSVDEINESYDFCTNPQYMLKSSFEEKINDEGKYEIEILSQTGNNLYNLKTVNYDWGVPNQPIISPSTNNLNYHCCEYFDISPFRGKTIYAGTFRDGVLRSNGVSFAVFFDENNQRIGGRDGITPNGVVVPTSAKLMSLMQHCGNQDTLTYINRDKYVIKLEPFVSGEKLVEHKSNKIKLLINEPLRKIDNVYKDRLCFKDGKLMVERSCVEKNLNVERISGKFNDISTDNPNLTMLLLYSQQLDNMLQTEQGKYLLCDKLATYNRYPVSNFKHNTLVKGNTYIGFNVDRTLLQDTTDNTYIEHINNLNAKIIYPITKPIYEEVLNEYGEPILLEGYENGTLYIDSTIVPTTTVRYTPKMESFSTLREVSNSNTMLTNDISDTIIPYMMEVDLMIMEKEMSLFNSLNKNIRKIGVEDMTSMQKRTQEMLERLIKGKTLNEQECKTRVTVYLNAGKITDEQAEELMLLISEVYA